MSCVKDLSACCGGSRDFLQRIRHCFLDRISLLFGKDVGKIEEDFSHVFFAEDFGTCYGAFRNLLLRVSKFLWRISELFAADLSEHFLHRISCICLADFVKFL